MQPIIDLFGVKDFIPHGYCLSWSPVLLWLHVVSDLLITFAYYSIPLTLVHFIRQRKDFPYSWLAALFAGFIVACGSTHLLSAITIWIPLYWLDGLLKAFTAIISVTTAILMLWIIPRALSLPSTAQLQAEIAQRKIAEDALRESEFRWKFAIEGAGDGLWDWDVVNNTVFFSTRWKEILGFTEDEIGNSPDEWKNRLHPEDEANTLALVQAYLERKTENYSSEYRLRCKDGSYKWILGRGMVVSHSEEGKPLRMIGTNTDISERKQLQEAQKETLSHLQKIASRVPGVVYQYRLHTDGSACFPFASDAIREIYGVSPEAVRDDASRVFAILHPDDRSRIVASIQTSARELTPWHQEYRVQFADGTERWLFGNALPEREADGSTLWHGFITDISQRKQMEEKLRDSDAFNVSILNSLTSHIAVLDEHGVIVNTNNAWRQFAQDNGLPESSHGMLGANYLDVCQRAFNQPYGDEAIVAHAGIVAVLSGEQESFHLDYPCHSSNLQRWFHMTVSPLQGSHRGAVIRHLNITERKQAERLLIQLKAMVDISLDGFWIVDPSGNLLQVNEAYAQISGYSIDELATMHISQLEAEEDPEQLKTHIEKVMAQGYDLFETRHRHKDGHLIDIEISSAFLPEFQHFCVFCRDITERKAMEAELKASEAKFRSIIEASPVPIALRDKQSNVAFLNPAFVHTFGYCQDDIPTLADWRSKAYPDPDYRHWVDTIWQTILEKMRREQTNFPPLEVAIRCKNNSIKTVLVTSAMIDPNGEYLVMLYDITERKQIEAKLNSIFNASVEGIITTDISNIIESANAGVETIFGYQPEELIGCCISKIIPSSPRENHDFSSLITLKCDGHIQEIEGSHKNGNTVPLDVSKAEYSIDGVHYFTYIVRDVSVRKEREQQDKKHLNELAHVTRLGLMGEMASGIAHEVNQPLAAVSSYTQVSLNLIKTENPDLAMITEILLKTQEQALRAGRIIHRMREFIKSDSKKRSTADINTLIYDAVSLCIAELKHNGIKLVYELESNLPPIYVDRIQIEQVIINLIRNSVDALQSSPATQPRQLTLSSQLTSNKGIQVSVKDNGPGMDEAQQQKILMPFYTTKTNGMGMGLSISRSLIEAHEGKLHFDSQTGTGTTFYVFLPVQEQSDKQQGKNSY